MEALRGVEAHIRSTGLDPKLAELVRTRVSQINGCAFCTDFHARAAAKLGESDRRLHALAVWREGGFFDQRERIALEWAEDLTVLTGDRVSDELYARAKATFNEDELVALALCIASINSWNRLQIAVRAQPKV